MTPAPDAPLDLLSAITPAGASRFTAAAPDDWQQGRGLFGGLVAAWMVRALEASEPERGLRSLTAQFCGPVQPGEVELTLEPLRRGSAVTTTAVRLVQAGGVQAFGVGVLGRARAPERDGTHLAPPALPDWRALAPLPVGPPLGPRFARFFEYRPGAGLPAGGGRPETSGWIRPRAPGAGRDAALLAACVDAWWPAALFTIEPQPRPMATVAFTLEVVGDLAGLDPEAPFFHRSAEAACRDGYLVELRELWGADGRLLALNQQTMAIIK